MSAPEQDRPVRTIPGAPFLNEALQRLGAPPVRRDGDQEVPAGPKALQTRARLLDAAQELFVEQSYITTSVNDVAKRAGVSLGTFYQYFTDLSDLLGELILGHAVGILDRAAGPRTTRRPFTLTQAIEDFVTAYAESAELSSVWEEATHTDERAAGLRRDLTRVLTDKARDDLLAAARAGHCRPFDEAEAALAARALTGMVDRFCYLTYVFDPPPEGPPAPAEAARVLTSLWAGAIQGHDDDR